MSFKAIAFLAVAAGFASITNAQDSGAGTTTRYWDCCKPSCAWSGKASVSKPVAQCDAKNSPLTAGDDMQKSSCDGGNAYMCVDQTPWAVSDTLAYGFAAANINDGGESGSCCSCYELSFTDSVLGGDGKKMVVQVTNSGTDLVKNQFDLAMPGGGVGIFNACSKQYSGATLGQQYGGIDDGTQCSTWGDAAAGCNFRFGSWFQNANNPTVDWKKVSCPKALTDKTGCVRTGETTTGDYTPAPAPSSSAAPAPSSSAAPAPSSSVASAPSSSAAASSSSYVAPVASSSSPATSSGSSPDTTSVPAGTLPAGTDAPYPTATYEAPSSSETDTSPEPTDAPSETVSACPVQYTTVYDL